MAASFPGAVPPARERFVESLGVRLHLVEWGDPRGEPLLLTHGFYDHARSFDVFAPLLAERYRVLALDSRGHGDSDWAEAYTWHADVLDVVNVLRDLGQPAHLVGHSRGGGLATDAALLHPKGVRRLVNLDGFGPPPTGWEAKNMRRYEGSAPELLAAFLDWRRTNVSRASFRPSPSLDELAARRREQNPRLSLDWLRYFAAHGARRVESPPAPQATPSTARSERAARAESSGQLQAASDAARSEGEARAESRSQMQAAPGAARSEGEARVESWSQVQAAPRAPRSEGPARPGLAGGRAESWSWKVDPYAARGFGPWRPEWIAPAWRGLAMPMLAVWGGQPDTWGLPDPWRSERLGFVPHLETAVIAGAGHFVHIEKPAETAAVVLDFLGRA